MTGISTVQRLTTEELHAYAPDDVMVASETRGGAIAAWALDGGVAFAAADDYGGAECWVSVVGSVEAARALVDAALADLGEQVAGLTVPRGVPLARWNADRGRGEHDEHDFSAWDLMAASAAPPVQAAEPRIVVLDDPAESQAFLDRVNPHHSIRADHELAETWAGARDEGSGALLAVGALARRRSGVPFLASIATVPEARGQGLGGALSAFLTRRVFEGGERLCTLSHYHPNEPARRVYLRLGYRTTHQFRSGEIRR